MTADTVLTKLAAMRNRLTWRVSAKSGLIRGWDETGQYYCPIVAACADGAAARLAPYAWEAHAHAAGLPLALAMRFVRAADNNRGHSVPLRAQLLAAVGLADDGRRA